MVINEQPGLSVGWDLERWQFGWSSPLVYQIGCHGNDPSFPLDAAQNLVSISLAAMYMCDSGMGEQCIHLVMVVNIVGKNHQHYLCPLSTFTTLLGSIHAWYMIVHVHVPTAIAAGIPDISLLI